MAQLTQRVAARIPENPVEFWLSRLDERTRPSNRSHLDRFMHWLAKQPSWENATPRDMLVRQLDSEDSYVVLDLVQRYVNQLVLRKSSKRKAYSVIRSYFAHNRCALPPDPSFRIRGDRPPVQAKLSRTDIYEVILSANLRYRSMILCKWQGFLDNERLIQVSNTCSEQIVSQLKSGKHPIRIDLPGRKSNENDAEGTFFTFNGADSITCLRSYFENERGWPKPGEPIWLNENRKPVTKSGFEATWMRLLRHAGKIPKAKGPPGSRYGYNLHEMRDEATTLLHTQAKNQGFDMDCAKFWCGQVGEIDPLKYDKFYRDVEYVRQQYLLAEPYLNIVSNPNGVNPQKILSDPDFVHSLLQNQEFIQALKKALKE